MTLQQNFQFISESPKRGRLDALRKGQIPQEYFGDYQCYLLHFAVAVGSEKHTAQHYLGIVRSSDPDHLTRRLKQHKKGNKKHCALTAALKEKKKRKQFEVAQVWKNVNSEFEHYLKSWKGHKQFCPVCHELPFF